MYLFTIFTERIQRRIGARGGARRHAAGVVRIRGAIQWAVDRFTPITEIHVWNLSAIQVNVARSTTRQRPHAFANESLERNAIVCRNMTNVKNAVVIEFLNLSFTIA